MDRETLLKTIAEIAKKIEAEKEYLTELDTAIGDGDHGINMARGFKAVEEKLPDSRTRISALSSKESACSWSPPSAALPARSMAQHS